jgi:aminoacrylate hydrolase
MPQLETSSGTLAYSKIGSGPAVLLIQGCGVVGEGWRPQVEALAERFTLVTFDNRGIGASRLSLNAPLSIEAMADDARVLARDEVLGDASRSGVPR